MNSQIKKREQAPDILKAIAIFFVVFIHGHAILQNSGTRYLEWVARSGVPIFICLWAYFAEISLLKGRSINKYTVQRFTHVFIVFVTWSFIYLFTKDKWTMPSFLSWLVRHFSGGAWPGQYFFILLLQLILLFPVIRWAYSRKYFMWMSVLLVFIFYILAGYAYESLPDIVQELKFRPFIYSLPYVYLGIALARSECYPTHPFIAIFILLIPAEFMILEMKGMEYGGYLTPGVLIGSICFILGMLSFKNFFQPKSKPAALLSLIAANTMTIFVANPLILGFFWYCRNKFLDDDITLSVFLAVPLSLLLTASVMAICLLLAAVIRKTRLTGILN